MMIEFTLLSGIFGKSSIQSPCNSVISDIPAFCCGAKKTNGEKIHPTQKPVELIGKFILDSTNEGDTVLDTFAGSGTTGVACVNLNRRFIGMELDNNYFKIAQGRINKAVLDKKQQLFQN